MYEDTMLEKLQYLLETKTEIMEAIQQIGNGDIDEHTLFRDYPDEIKKIHANLIDVCRYLDFIVNGGNLSETLESTPNYKDTYPYVQDILYCKELLAEALNEKGIECDNTYPLRHLIYLIYQIRSPEEVLEEYRSELGHKLDLINGEEIY